MKKIFRTITNMLIAVLVLSTGSCEDQLTTGSSTEVTGEQIFGSTEGLNKILRAAYVNFMYGDLTYGGQEAGAYVGIPGFNLYYDISGEDIVVTINYGMSPEDCYQFNMARTDAARFADKIWRIMYLSINQANTVLDNVDDCAGTQADKDALKGQSLAMRGISYFHLVMNYQQTYAIAKNKRGVILRTTVDFQKQPIDLGFSTVEEIYTQIVKDLTEAKTLLAGFKRSDEFKWQLTADVASGYLARVYQVMQNWQGALNEAGAVYEKYSTLMTKEQWCGGQADTSIPEIIWAVHNNSLSNNWENTQFAYWHNQDPSYGEGMSDGVIYNYLALLVDQKYVDLFDNTDYRGTKCTKTWNDGDPQTNHVTDADEKPVMFWHRTRAQAIWKDKWAYNKFKYYGEDGLGLKGSHNYADYSIMRSSEMLLIKAEAEANLDKPGDALASLNKLQATRQAQLTTTTNKNDLLEAVYVERRKELLGEGITGMYDLVRLQKDLVRYAATESNPAGHFPWGLTNLDPVSTGVAKMPSNDYRYFCQIPIIELANNNAISLSDQNPSRGQ
jgi:hypothetical protein